MLVGTYAQAAVLGRGRMSHRVRDYRQYLPSLFPLPHPSWRSQLWIQQNPWVDSELLPTLRNAVAGALSKEPVCGATTPFRSTPAAIPPEPSTSSSRCYAPPRSLSPSVCARSPGPPKPETTRVGEEMGSRCVHGEAQMPY